MDDCCVKSFVDKGFREGFKLAVFGDTHTCETCGRRYRLAEEPSPSPALRHHVWKEITQ